MKTPFLSSRTGRWVTSIAIFLLSFLPRAIYPVSRTALWYKRSVLFMDAVLKGDWAGTYQRYHPGVTTMWLSGAAVKLFGTFHDLTTPQLLGDQRTPVGTLHAAYGAGVLALATAVAVGIVLAYRLVSRLIDARVGVIAGALLALDPYYLTQSKAVDVNALLGTFMLMSVLYLVAYVQQSHKWDLLWSGVFAGLAMLTKSPSLFLVPYVALLVGSNCLRKPSPGAGLEQRLINQIRPLGSAVWTLVIWLAVAVAVLMLLFPATWVNPRQILKVIGGHAVYHLTVPHYNPVYFSGRITVRQDPGLLFYVATILWRTTWLTLPASVAADVLTLKQLRYGRHDHAIWWLMIYLVGFALQMNLSDRKEMRYLLPVFPAIDVLAAFGLVKLALAAGRVPIWKTRKWAPVALLIFTLAIQAAVVLSHHPYYGTHYNYLLGGPKVARRILPLQEHGEGLDLAARFLNTLPDAEKATVVMHPLAAEMVLRDTVSRVDAGSANPAADYRLYYLNQTMRRLDADLWERAWLADQKMEPLWTAEFGGLTYVWIYGKLSD